MINNNLINLKQNQPAHVFSDIIRCLEFKPLKNKKEIMFRKSSLKINLTVHNLNLIRLQNEYWSSNMDYGTTWGSNATFQKNHTSGTQQARQEAQITRRRWRRPDEILWIKKVEINDLISVSVYLRILALHRAPNKIKIKKDQHMMSMLQS